MSTKIRHLTPGCDGTTAYPRGDCKKCMIVYSTNYTKTEKGAIVKEKSAAKQRFARRSKKIKDVATQLQSDLDIIGIEDESYKEDLEKIKTIIQSFCDLDLSAYKSLKGFDDASSKK